MNRWSKFVVCAVMVALLAVLGSPQRCEAEECALSVNLMLVAIFSASV
jgi:hypothetical protein